MAIAASLLPPIINSGMCLGFALAGAPRFPNYHQRDFLVISGYSLCLFLLNVVCIYSVAQLFFRIKHVYPVRSLLVPSKDLPAVLTSTGSRTRTMSGTSSQGSATVPEQASRSRWDLVRVFVNRSIVRPLPPTDDKSEPLL